MSEVPVLCVQFETSRLCIAIPYALLLNVTLSEDETRCAVHFGTHRIHLRGRHIRGAFDALSRGCAVCISKCNEDSLFGRAILGPLISGISIEPLDESSP